MFEAIIASPKTTLNFTFDPDLPYEISDLSDNINLVCVCAQSDAKLEFVSAGQTFVGLHPRVSTKIDPWFLALRARIDLVRRYLGKIDWREKVLARGRDCLEQEEELHWANLVTTGERQTITTKIEDGGPVGPFEVSGLLAAAVMVRLNDLYIVALCYWDADIHVEGQSVEMHVQNCRVWRTLLLDEHGSDSLERAYKDFAAFCRDAAAGGNVVMRTLTFASNNE
jgi:hypothetical protein